MAEIGYINPQAEGPGPDGSKRNVLSLRRIYRRYNSKCLYDQRSFSRSHIIHFHLRQRTTSFVPRSKPLYSPEEHRVVRCEPG